MEIFVGFNQNLSILFRYIFRLSGAFVEWTEAQLINPILR